MNDGDDQDDGNYEPADTRGFWAWALLIVYLILVGGGLVMAYLTY